MEREFNLIDEPWVCVMLPDCTIKEVSLMDVFTHAHEYDGLAGEVKTQDFAVLRLLLAVVHTVFSRYDRDGNEIKKMGKNTAIENWQMLWENKKFPEEPFRKYFEKWHDRFWLFDEEYPFCQVRIENKSLYKSAKLIGSISQSGNKNRLFIDRKDEGLILSYAEGARWLINLIAYEDIASKYPTPKKTWLCELGLIAAKGNNLFETLMLNYTINYECKATSQPSWEKEKPSSISNNNELFFENVNKVPLCELFTVQSRYAMLHRENGCVDGYFISGGEYFSSANMFSEPMTIWKKDKKSGDMFPMRHDPSISAWREFGTLAALKNAEEENDASKGVQIPGVIEWIIYLKRKNILDENFMLNICTADMGYNFMQATSLPINDCFSDDLTFNANLLMDIGDDWRRIVNEEIEKCEKAAMYVAFLSCDIQKAGGSDDKDSEYKVADEAKRQFYERIDKPFRSWLKNLNTDGDCINEKCRIEKQLKRISLRFGEELVERAGAGAILGKEVNEKDKKKRYSAASAINIFTANISKTFKYANGGDNDGEQ